MLAKQNLKTSKQHKKMSKARKAFSFAFDSDEMEAMTLGNKYSYIFYGNKVMRGRQDEYQLEILLTINLWTRWSTIARTIEQGSDYV